MCCVSFLEILKLWFWYFVLGFDLFSFKFAANVETVEDEERNEFAKESKIIDKADEDEIEEAKGLI